jgi:nucleoside-diphosphate-sugar epimerase
MQALVTGCTGHIGSHLTLELLRRGARVLCVARSRPGERAAARVLHALRLARNPEPLGDGELERVAVLDHDLLEQQPGRLAELVAAAGGVESIWHCAAETNLSPLLAMSEQHVNARTTSNVLELALALAHARFHHVSTAYQCGTVARAAERRSAERPAAFRNAYEHSKWTCEQLVARALGSRASVYRPSIVLGKADSGRVESWQGYYAFIRKVHRMLEARGVAACDGPEIGVYGNEDTELDFVFVDSLARTLVAFGLDPRSTGETYHLTAPVRVPLWQVADDLAFLTGRRPLLRSEGAERGARASPILAAVNPYLQSSPVFEREKACELGRSLGLGEPRMTRRRSRHHIGLAIATGVRLAG